MATKCPAPIGLCAIRVTLLDADGTPSSDTDNSYVSNKTVSLGWTPVVSEGQDREVRSGCDCIIASAKAPDILKRFSFEIAQGALEPGLIAMMLGQQPVLDAEGDPIGVNWLADQLTCGGTQSLVAFEGWMNAYDVDHLDPDLPYIHLLWPATRWQLAANTASADFFQPALTGFSQGNANFGDPYDDFPTDGTGLMTSEVFSFWQTDEDLPTPSCGYQTLVVA